ncbi:MAG: AAA family ATPase [Candidatus Berkelbacteria bacterium]|nr:AAA family ATPase [Candidatus Berkelbacteria bacterium]
MNFQTEHQYGALQPSFSFETTEGYNVLVGANNSGKSSILQMIFKEFLLNRDNKYTEIIGEKNIFEMICLILSDRNYVHPSGQTGDKTFENYNKTLFNLIKLSPKSYGEVDQSDSARPSSNELSRLLSDTDPDYQVDEMKKLLEKLGLPPFSRKKMLRIIIDEDGIEISNQGSGFRAVFPILAAITNPDIKILLIDEPELSLEPKLQKKLRDLFYEVSEEKEIVIATQSNLFLNRKNYNNNFKIIKKEGNVTFEKINSEDELSTLTFNLLGNELADLFFPENFLIVEGLSDQVITEKALALIDEEQAKNIKVLSAGGDATKTKKTLSAIEDNLKPLLAINSPYKERVVVMIDNQGKNNPVVASLKEYLKDHLVELDKQSIEEYVDPSIYEKSGLVKDEVINNIRTNKSNQKELNEIKKDVSSKIAESLTPEDLEKIPLIKEAAEKALLYSQKNDELGTIKENREEIPEPVST